MALSEELCTIIMSYNPTSMKDGGSPSCLGCLIFIVFFGIGILCIAGGINMEMYGGAIAGVIVCLIGSVLLYKYGYKPK